MSPPPPPQSPVRKGRRESAKPPSRIRILLVDDHELVRKGVRALLEADGDLAVVGEARDGREAVEMAARLLPDVVLMDIAMPRLNGMEATRQILDATPGARVLILSAHSDEEYVNRAVSLGVAGYVLKGSSLEDLGLAIRAARAGKRWFSPSISAHPAGHRSVSADGLRGTPTLPRVRLTSREAEVLQLIAEGKASKQVATALGLSIKTVEKHRQSLMKKLDIHDVAGLTRYAILIGSIEGRDRSATS